MTSSGRDLRSACGMLAALGLALGSAPAFGGTPEKDKSWDALLAEAKAHGGEETRLDKSASYVFQRPDGSYLSLTRLLASDKGRSVCLIAKQQNATACIDWDTGKLTLGSRADVASPWKFRGYASLDAFEAEQPGVVEQLFSSISDMFMSGKFKSSHSKGYWVSLKGGGTKFVYDPMP